MSYKTFFDVHSTPPFLVMWPCKLQYIRYGYLVWVGEYMSSMTPLWSN